MVFMKGWKTWLSAFILLGTAWYGFQHKTLTIDQAIAIASAGLGLVGIGHKIEKSANVKKCDSDSTSLLEIKNHLDENLEELKICINCKSTRKKDFHFDKFYSNLNQDVNDHGDHGDRDKKLLSELNNLMNDDDDLYDLGDRDKKLLSELNNLMNDEDEDLDEDEDEDEDDEDEDLDDEGFVPIKKEIINENQNFDEGSDCNAGIGCLSNHEASNNTQSDFTSTGSSFSSDSTYPSSYDSSNGGVTGFD